MRLRQVAQRALAIAEAPAPRTGSESPRLTEPEFKQRFLSQFQDEAYRPLGAELDRIAGAAWEAYAKERKSPHTSKAGIGYADPDYLLSDEWRAAKHAIEAAQRRHDDPEGSRRILLINGSSRSEHSCPGEVSRRGRI